MGANFICAVLQIKSMSVPTQECLLGGGDIQIFAFPPTNFFRNQLFLSSFQKKLVRQSTNIRIFSPHPPINALVSALCSVNHA